MYLCLCNELKDSQITRAADSGANSVGEVFARLGCAPVCGSCVPYVKECLGQCPRGEREA